MDTKKIILNDSGIAILGNAMLLSCLMKQAGLLARHLDESRMQEVGRDRAGCSALKDALYAAGMLDDRTSKAIDLSKDKLGDGSANTVRRLSEIENGETQIATLRFADFVFPATVLERYRVADALAVADPLEFQTPIAQLWPSELVCAVRALVIDYMKDFAALDMGLTRAEATLIGLDGLVTRRSVREPPKWHLWNSEAVRQTRKNMGWLEEMREKVRRHVLRPAERAYGDTSSKYDGAELGLQLEQLGPSIKDGHIPFFEGLSGLGNQLCKEPIVSEDTVHQLFPSYGAMLTHGSFGADADPFNFFTFMSGQVAWHAVKEGWALCIAEDGLEGGCFTWVPPDAFPSLTDNGELALPDEIGVTGCFDLDERVKSTLGAERLWFVLIGDAAEALGLPEPSPADDLPASQPSRNYNQGFTTLDAPFVEEGAKMLETGDPKSALNAAQQLVSKYGEISESGWKPGCTEIRSFTVGGAEARLQKAISKARKKRRL